MIKTIDFSPYTEATIKAINDDGSVLCDLRGEGYSDTDICFPADSQILKLTPQEIEEFHANQAETLDIMTA